MVHRTATVIGAVVLAASCHAGSLCQPVVQSTTLYEIYCNTAPQHLCFTTADTGF